MSLLLQTGGDSIHSASGRSGTLDIPTPMSLTAGDHLLVIVSARGEGPIEVVPEVSSLEWSASEHQVDGGAIVLFSAYIPSASVAEEVRNGGIAITSVYQEDSLGRCTNAIVLRATGGDSRRFVEAFQVAKNDLSAEGVLTIPSFDPEYRSDNTIMYVSTSSWKPGSPTPVSAVGGAAPVLTETLAPEVDADGMDGLSTTLSTRRLTSPDATGISRVSFTTEPDTAWAVGFMLRSANEPPVINVPESWSAEVGRRATIAATVTDPDRTPVSFTWSQESGPEAVEIGNAYSRAFSFTPSVPGEHIFRLTAVDVDGGRTEAQTRVLVPTGVTGPTTIVSSPGWTDQDGGPVSQVEILSDQDDGTFVRTIDLPDGSPLVLGLPPIYGGAAITVTVRGAATNPSPQITRTVVLSQADGTVIAERTYPLSSVMRSYVFTTTRAETALISNRASMRLTIMDEVG